MQPFISEIVNGKVIGLTNIKYKCPFCGKPKEHPSLICKCEVENTGMDEFWKD